ncbi:MAG TPA: histidine kinase dimerization/phospho-acceptor domain-containing protein [Gaiellaceae bacterium]|nr:histidine kinase dimerization/phospho-acceptor domain-containing protein [Gaiellaceae bacterium]
MRPNQTLAHEINNPLFAILGLTELLLAEVEKGSRMQERLELIHDSALEIKEIVRTAQRERT